MVESDWLKVIQVQCVCCQPYHAVIGLLSYMPIHALHKINIGLTPVAMHMSPVVQFIEEFAVSRLNEGAQAHVCRPSLTRTPSD